MIDVVIATYNRFEKALSLARSLQRLNEKFVSRLLLIDSTDSAVPMNNFNDNVVRVVTKHRNQPYQRYLGYCVSKADYIIFLDDDMEITEVEGLFEKTSEIFKQDSIVAIAYNFSEKHDDTTLSKVPVTAFKNRLTFFKKIKDLITGYPRPNTGKYGLCGTRGPKPMEEVSTEHIGGGAFAVRRDVMYRNFNFQLFDIYENGLGKGEDGILGYSLAKQGKIYFNRDHFFTHNDQNDSTYSTDIYKFARRVAFSRLYLSLEKTRLDNGNLFLARVHYHYYMFWRIIGFSMNYCLNPSKNRKDLLYGSLNGWWLATYFKFDRALTRTAFWKDEAIKDISR